ncbi:LysM peptidoglycan-binding domain-containing protein [Candidatus Saccharibacteria bacterium]|nr:LysM peptidoglycan-binding domain-containing protein [Candidatus Saccharibacteria bacterium]
MLLIVLIAIGYRAPQKVTGLSNAAQIAQTPAETKDKKTVNNVIASSIAANVASTTNLSVAPAVASLAISTQLQSELPSSDDSSISKPQIIQVSSASRDISTYTVGAGDTIDTIAAKFGVSKDTIKFANNLTSDNLTVGKVLDVLPRDGIVYTVKSGDTAATIADKYKADASTITTYNDLEISGVTPGLKIVIPNGVLPTTERPGYVAPYTFVAAANTRTSTGFSGYRAGSVGNKYAFGNCTWYAYERRAAMGKPVGSFWGNGGSWHLSGGAAGFRVDRIPEVGAALVEIGNPGHVAVVESVGADGSVVVSEMNNRAYGGFNIVNNRTISAGQAANYTYVH